MAVCELCGKDGITKQVKVAGTVMQACDKCKSMGEEVNREPSFNNTHTFRKRKKDEVEVEAIDNVVSVINRELAKKNVNLHQVARLLNIKESTLNKYFSGKINFDLATLYRFENYLEMKLTKEVENKKTNVEDYTLNTDDEQPSSLGDLLLQKMKEVRK